MGGPLGGVTRGVTWEVPWEVLPWRSLGRCDEDDSCGDQSDHNKNDENGNEDACKRGSKFCPLFSSILMFFVEFIKDC
jgi:hypothetical protein